MLFGYFTLIVALIISAVAAYYSIVGLTAIFAAAVIPIIIMGAALEVGKITAAVWLKVNWSRARFTYKLYLVPAVAMLMVLTSMGIFGFLSKAHSDQSLISGDVQSQISIFDEKIKTQRDNIELARKAIAQMDAQVEARLSRGDSEAGAERAVQIRRQQAAERNKLQREIAEAQKNITQLQEQRAPIAAEVRKVEAEVGPIKYIAALIYGDNPDGDLLERAVRWVIIIIVAVFDPLALVLILAAQQSIRWAREDAINNNAVAAAELKEEEKQPLDEQGDASTNQDKRSEETVINDDPQVPPESKSYDPERYPYLGQGFGKDTHPPGVEPVKPLVYIAPEQLSNTSEQSVPVQSDESLPNLVEETTKPPIIEQTPIMPRYDIIGDGYVSVEGKVLHERVLGEYYPEVLAEIRRQRLDNDLLAQADNAIVSPSASRATFGTEFPANPVKGEMFLNVSTLPSRLYKFNGSKWISVDKSATDLYTYDKDYLRFLADQISRGVISVDDLTVGEQEQIENYLKNNE